MAIIIIAAVSCNTPKDIALSKPEDENLQLESILDKRNYLESIFKDDQKVRSEKGSEIMIEHGKDSEEFRAYINTQIKQDEQNLNKIEAYLKNYGHPVRSEVGEIAAITPWSVIHHSQGYEPKKRNFEALYKAYKNNDIDDGQISMLLGRMYLIKNGERSRKGSPLKSADEIKQLIEELGLDNK
jgi:hypothetical protein